MKRLLLMLLMLFPLSASAGIVVVVSASSDIGALGEEEVANLFLARTKHLPNGDKAALYELSSSDLRLAFYNQIAGKNKRQINAYWASLIFTGKGKPPKELGDIAELESKLAEQPGAIAYVSDDMVSDTMRVVCEID